MAIPRLLPILAKRGVVVREKGSLIVGPSQAVSDKQTGLDGALAQCVQATRRTLHICDLMETLADELPKRMMPVWREVQHQCDTVARPYFRTVGDVVVTGLLESADITTGQKEVLHRLHADAANRAHDLQDLHDLIRDALHTDQFAREPGALGYALRGHFDGMRNDMGWHLDVLWPLAQRTASPAQVFLFASAITDGRVVH